MAVNLCVLLSCYVSSPSCWVFSEPRAKIDASVLTLTAITDHTLPHILLIGMDIKRCIRWWEPLAVRPPPLLCCRPTHIQLPSDLRPTVPSYLSVPVSCYVFRNLSPTRAIFPTAQHCTPQTVSIPGCVKHRLADLTSQACCYFWLYFTNCTFSK